MREVIRRYGPLDDPDFRSLLEGYRQFVTASLGPEIAITLTGSVGRGDADTSLFLPLCCAKLFMCSAVLLPNQDPSARPLSLRLSIGCTQGVCSAQNERRCCARAWTACVWVPRCRVADPALAEGNSEQRKEVPEVVLSS